jgi:hypothetical protein
MLDHPSGPTAKVLVRSGMILVLGLLLTPVACTDSSAPTAASDANSYIRSLPSWQEFSPTLPDANAIAGSGTESYEPVAGVTYHCQTTPYSITATPEKIVTLDPDSNILWLGALLQGDGYRGGIGSLQEWPVRERAPLTISIDLLDGNNTTTIEHPDLASVTQAIGNLVAYADASGHHGGSSVSFSQENTYSITQGMLALGVSAGYAGVSVKASLSVLHSAAERTVTAYFVQRMFTVSVVLPDQPGDMFDADFTTARMQEEVDRGNVGPDNLPVYVANVVYGRILMFSFTSTASITDIRAALAASFSSIAGGSIEGRYLDILNQAKISVVTVGGEGKNATALIQSGQLKDYFNEDPALTSARPISYTVRNLGDNSIAKVSETTNYDLKECTAVPTTGAMTIDVTPNDASVEVAGPNSFTRSSSGDQNLDALEPGGYSIKVTRAGYDSTTVETEVTAGDTTALTVALTPIGPPPTGAVYTLTLQRLLMQNVSCSGESQADVYYSIASNGRTIASRTRDNSVPLYAGQWVTLGQSVTDTVRTNLSLLASVYDADPIGSDDPMGTKTATWKYPNIPTGSNLGVTINSVSGCSTVLQFSITKDTDIYTAPPMVAAAALPAAGM